MEKELRHTQCAYMGKLLAGFTHELKNHLAIINESAGLMGDLLDMGKGKEEEALPKLKSIIETISDRINLADIMLKHLNGLAHRMDTPQSLFSLTEVVSEELALIKRFSRLKGIDIEVECGEDSYQVFSNPTLLQFVIFVLFDMALSNLESGGKIKVVFKSSIQGPQVQLEMIGNCLKKNKAAPNNELLKLIEFSSKELGAKFEIFDKSEFCKIFSITFTFSKP